MAETLTLEIDVEVSDVHSEWLDDVVDEIDEDVSGEELLSQFFAGDGIDRQVEEYIHNMKQDVKRADSETQAETRRNPMS